MWLALQECLTSRLQPFLYGPPPLAGRDVAGVRGRRDALPFRSHYLYDIDSMNFALGMERFASPRIPSRPRPIFCTYVSPANSITSPIWDLRLPLSSYRKLRIGCIRCVT